MSNQQFNTLPMAYPQYYQYGHVFTKVCGPGKYISVVLMPEGATSISTGVNPATALPCIADVDISNEKEFNYACDKAMRLITGN